LFLKSDDVEDIFSEERIIEVRFNDSGRKAIIDKKRGKMWEGKDVKDIFYTGSSMPEGVIVSAKARHNNGKMTIIDLERGLATLFKKWED